MPKNTALVLIILDGWGYSEQSQYNAIAKAHTPQWDAWWKSYPHCLLQASGRAVGLPTGQMGNSEVGHMHIGAGRIIQQDFTRINQAIGAGDFANNGQFLDLLAKLKKTGKALHIMGLLSPGGVHSHEDHLFALLAFCDTHDFHSVYLHVFLDGRDCPPQSALQSVERLEEVLKKHPVATISSISGRYYAMDRDKRWERLEPVYHLITQGLSYNTFEDAQHAITYYYEQKLTDEFIPPTRIGKKTPLKDGDALLYFNFRADRARQLTEIFVNPLFSGFPRKNPPSVSHFFSMTEYDSTLKTTPIFPPQNINHSLGQIISAAGLKQLRLAETEKYAHVTFFFNGGVEKPFPNEERLLIPSPKTATYDLQPQMSAPELTTALVAAIESGTYDVIICNYANADMVGHSGNMQAAILAIESLDLCMQQVGKAIATSKGSLLITADHGNAEIMFDESTGQPHTAHTRESVPFLYIGDDFHFNTLEGNLSDVAPTVLYLLGLPIPPEMTGMVLLEKNHE